MPFLGMWRGSIPGTKSLEKKSLGRKSLGRKSLERKSLEGKSLERNAQGRTDRALPCQENGMDFFVVMCGGGYTKHKKSALNCIFYFKEMHSRGILFFAGFSK